MTALVCHLLILAQAIGFGIAPRSCCALEKPAHERPAAAKACCQESEHSVGQPLSSNSPCRSEVGCCCAADPAQLPAPAPTMVLDDHLAGSIDHLDAQPGSSALHPVDLSLRPPGPSRQTLLCVWRK